MVENIVAGVLMAVAALAGVWVLWMENSTKRKKCKKEEIENPKMDNSVK